MIRIIKCDFNNPFHNQKVIQLLDAYMQDPMGGGRPMPEYTRANLINGLSNHPSAFVLFALKDDDFTGMITCFINFSTFKAKPFINVHDIVVLKAYRGLGIGRAMLEEVIRMSVDNDYGKSPWR
ncbi:MAG: GNAT family N-acetyltransferase [Bacteroidetes bacterium]|nr:GNAT family N-acetyltransferase [Bacteroidota bacterium]